MASSSQLNCKNIIDQYYDNLQDDPQQIEGVLKFLKSGIIENNGNNSEGAIEAVYNLLKTQYAKERSISSSSINDRDNMTYWFTDRLKEIGIRVNCPVELSWNIGKGRMRKIVPHTIKPSKQLLVTQKEIEQLRSAKSLVVSQATPAFDRAKSTNKYAIKKCLHRCTVGRSNIIVRIGRMINRARFSHSFLKFKKTLLFLTEKICINGESVLITGKPGSGKTSFLRELIKITSIVGEKKNSMDGSNGRVVVVDKNDEILGGVENTLFPAWRSSDSGRGKNTPGLLNALQTCTPMSIVADEIGDQDEALDLKNISEQGISIIATSHFNCSTGENGIPASQALVKKILNHNSLSMVAGGKTSMLLSAEEATEMNVKKRFHQSRAEPPFQWCLYMRDSDPSQWPVPFDVRKEVKLYFEDINSKMENSNVVDYEAPNKSRKRQRSSSNNSSNGNYRDNNHPQRRNRRRKRPKKLRQQKKQFNCYFCKDRTHTSSDCPTLGDISNTKSNSSGNSKESRMAKWSKLFPELKKTHRQHNNNKNSNNTNKNNPWYNSVHPWNNNLNNNFSNNPISSSTTTTTTTTKNNNNNNVNYNSSRNNDGGKNNKNNDYKDSLPTGVYLDVGR